MMETRLFSSEEEDAYNMLHLSHHALGERGSHCFDARSLALSLSVRSCEAHRAQTGQWAGGTLNRPGCSEEATSL